MLAISIDLLTGRYHATPWGRAASEGAVEWPPSPWRLGRALVSAWHRDDPAERPDEGVLDALLGRLAAPPRFSLPRGAVGHSRHYMPLGSGKPRPGGIPTSSPVLDAFVRVAAEPLVIHWDGVDLTHDELATLERLIARIGYLGRAESTSELRIVDRAGPGDADVIAMPLDDARPDGVGDIVPVLCLRPDATAEALSQPTAERRRQGHEAAPGGRFVTYLRTRRALEPRRRRPPPRPHRRPSVLRFALEGAALPPITDAMPVAELFRRRALARVPDSDAESVRLLRGADESGRPLEGHAHCHYLASDEDGDGRIDHLTAWCPAGFPPGAVEALDVEELTSWALDHPLRTVLVATDPSRVPTRGPLATARRWRSHTPFVLVRHPKRRAGRIQDGPLDQVRLELSRRGLPPASVQPLRDDGRRHWGAFTRHRQGRERRAAAPRVAGALIEFDEDVRGPLCLGGYSHFGMGLFLPA